MTTWVPEDAEDVDASNSQDLLTRDEAALTPEVSRSLTARQLETLGKQLVKPEYKIKVYMVLVDSDKHDWGIVEDTLNDILWVPGKGQIIGTWSRTKLDNCIHISMCSSIDALVDNSIQTFAQYAEERRQKAAGVARAPRKSAKSAKSPKSASAGESSQEQLPAPVISLDEQLKFNSLRAKLRGG